MLCATVPPCQQIHAPERRESCNSRAAAPRRYCRCPRAARGRVPSPGAVSAPAAMLLSVFHFQCGRRARLHCTVCRAFRGAPPRTVELLFQRAVQAHELFVPQGHHWIHAHRSPRRKVERPKTSRDQKCCPPHNRQWVVCPNKKEQPQKNPPPPNPPRQSKRNSDQRQFECLAEDHAAHGGQLRAQR